MTVAKNLRRLRLRLNLDHNFPRRQLLALRDSGRWDLEAHTDNGHRLVLSSPTDQYGPFLTSLEWLPARHRYETLAEYTTRVTVDLDRCVAYLRAIGVDPKIFVFPFSAATTRPRAGPPGDPSSRGRRHPARALGRLETPILDAPLSGGD